MAKNKKPRKKYRPHAMALPGLTDEQISFIQGYMAEVGLVMEMKILKGNAKKEDLRLLGDFFYWCAAAFLVRTDYLAPESEDWCKEFFKGTFALESVCRRTDQLGHVVLTAQELKLLRECFFYFWKPMEEALLETPIDLVRIYHTMRRHVNADKPEMIGVPLTRYQSKMKLKEAMDRGMKLLLEDGSFIRKYDEANKKWLLILQ